VSTPLEPGDDPGVAVLPPRDQRAASRWPWVFLRVTSSFALAGMVVLAALAGGFLSGNYAALAGHARLGEVTAVLIMLQTAACVAVWKRGGGPSWPLRASIGQVLAAIAMFPLGVFRILALHLPVSVALGIGVAFLAVWSWRNSAPGRGTS
jgi:hypothetical protein